MSCSCQIDTNYDNGPDFCTESIVTARKEHKCYECGDIIKPKEQYENCSGKWDGEMKSFKTCLVCKEIRDAFFCSWTYGEVFLNLEEEICETDGNLSQECINSLSEPAKKIVIGMIDDYLNKK